MVHFYSDRILFFLVCLAKDIGFQGCVLRFFVSKCHPPAPCFVPIKKRVFGNFATSKNK